MKKKEENYEKQENMGILLAGVAGAGCLLLAGCGAASAADGSAASDSVITYTRTEPPSSSSEEELLSQTFFQIEETLRLLDGVTVTGLEYTQGAQEATVTLQVEPGQVLPEENRAAVQNVAAGAFNLPQGNVQIVVEEASQTPAITYDVAQAQASLSSLSEEERMDLRVDQLTSNTESVLRQIDGVAEAAVQYTQGAQEAAVALQMEEGQALSEEARAAVQNLVAGAFNIPEENVQVAVQ